MTSAVAPRERFGGLGPITVLLLAVLLVSIVFRLVVIAGYPLGVDQGVFGWFGRIIAEGGRPYVDAWDTKGPGVFVVAGLLQLLMPGEFGMRAFDIILQLFAAVVLVRNPIGADRPRAGWLAAGAYLAGYASLGYHETAQPDCWANAILVIGLVPALRSADGTFDRYSPWRVARACLAVGAVVLFKPTYGALAAVPVAIVLWHLLRDRREGVVKPSLSAVVALPMLAGLAPLALCLLWLWATGALSTMWDVVIVWNSSVYASSQMVDPRLLAYSTVRGFLSNVQWWPLAIFATVGLLSEFRTRRAVLVMIWAAAATLEIAAQRKFWGYHWTPLLGPIAVGISFLVAPLDAVTGWRVWRSRIGRTVALVAALSGVLRAAWHERARLVNAPSSPTALASLEGYDARLKGFDDLMRVIEAETTPQQRVYFFGTMAIGNYVANRPSVGRLSLSRPLIDGAGTALRAQYREEFWRLWRAAPPAMVVAYSPHHCDLFAQLRWTCLPAYPELQQELAASYSAPQEIGGFVLYRRRS